MFLSPFLKIVDRLMDKDPFQQKIGFFSSPEAHLTAYFNFDILNWYENMLS